MRQRSPFQLHLAINEVLLPPTREWTPELPGWVFIHVAAGTAYWLNLQAARELPAGSVLLVSPETRGCIRASQLGRVTLRFFTLDPACLVELMNLGEQEFFRQAGARGEFAVRILSPGDVVSTRFSKLCEGERSGNFVMRIALLQLFVEVLGSDLSRLKPTSAGAGDAKERLTDLLLRTPAAELLELTFSDLVQKARCTPRHLSRVFREALGMSFREKQTEIRLTRARELLATTGYKVVDVALESGYQSLSLFNFMFKRRFGVSPGRWREQAKLRRTLRKSASRLTLLRLPAAADRLAPT